MTAKITEEKTAWIKSLVKLHQPRMAYGEMQPAEVGWSGTSPLTPDEARIFANEILRVSAEVAAINLEAGLVKP